MTDVDSRFEALQIRYHAALPGKRAEIIQAWQAVRMDCADAESQQTLLRLVHRLAGSAESYGFAEIGRHAARMDLLLDQVRSSGDPVQRAAAMCAMLDTLSHDIQALLVELKRSIDSNPANECPVA